MLSKYKTKMFWRGLFEGGVIINCQLNPSSLIQILFVQFNFAPTGFVVKLNRIWNVRKLPHIGQREYFTARAGIKSQSGNFHKNVRAKLHIMETQLLKVLARSDVGWLVVIWGRKLLGLGWKMAEAGTPFWRKPINLPSYLMFAQMRKENIISVNISSVITQSMEYLLFCHTHMFDLFCRNVRRNLNQELLKCSV